MVCNETELDLFTDYAIYAYRPYGFNLPKKFLRLFSKEAEPLEADGQSVERRRQRMHPVYTKPELLAAAPNQVWSWDITKLKGPAKWTCFHLYVILAIFSRYVVGWMVALSAKPPN